MVDTQLNKNALITDPYLHVLGLSNIYAIGDCGTVTQNHLLEKCDEMFRYLDENGDGVIDPEEFKKFLPRYSFEFPQLLEYAKKAEVLFAEADVNKVNSILSSHDRFTATFRTTMMSSSEMLQ